MRVAPAMERPTHARPERLRRSSDIRWVLGRRSRRRGRCVDVYVRDTGSVRPPRVAVVAGRQVGSAVRRNRAKRRIRAAVRDTGMPHGRDAVLVARAAAVEAPFDAILREVEAVRAPVRRPKDLSRG